MFLIGIVLVVALVTLALLLLRLERRQARGEEDRAWALQLFVPVGIAGGLLWWIGQNGPRDVLFEASLPSEAIVLILLPILVILAALVLMARNPRRFVLGLCVFAIIVFIALYPDLSALPMPNNIAGIYTGLIPTWFYGFEFSVNLQVSTHQGLISVNSLECVALALFVAGIASWVALERRRTIGYWRAALVGAGASADAADGDASSGSSAPTDGDEGSGSEQ